MIPRVIKAYPPNFNELAKTFPIKGKPGIIYAYGERIYNPSGVVIRPWVIAHETVHCTRQLLYGLANWWIDYAMYKTFRLEEEVLAHKREWTEITNSSMSQRDKSRYLAMMVERLSGPLYGSMVSQQEARGLITGEWNAVHPTGS